MEIGAGQKATETDFTDKGHEQASAQQSGSTAVAPLPEMAWWALPVASPVNRQDRQMDGECGFGETIRAGSHPSKRKWPLGSLQGASPQPLGHSLLLHSALFCLLLASADAGGRKKGRFVSNLVSRGWSKTSVFPKQSRDSLH